MKTTSIVKQFLEENPHILDCLTSGLINYSKLSRMIMHEKQLDDTMFSAILVSCRRFRSQTDPVPIRQTIQDSKLEVSETRQDLVNIRLRTENKIHLLAGHICTILSLNNVDIKQMISKEFIDLLITKPDLSKSLRLLGR